MSELVDYDWDEKTGVARLEYADGRVEFERHTRCHLTDHQKELSAEIDRFERPDPITGRTRRSWFSRAIEQRDPSATDTR